MTPGPRDAPLRRAPPPPDWVRRFHQDGFAHLGRVLDPQTVEALRDGVGRRLARAARETGIDDLGRYLALVTVWPEPWRQSGLFRGLHGRADLAARAARAMGTHGARVIRQQVVFRPPRAGRALPYHQDLPQWPTDDARCVALWLALDDVTPTSGALRYVPGSHQRHGNIEPVAAPVGAGEALIHHARVWHAGGANHTDAWRRAVVMVYGPV